MIGEFIDSLVVEHVAVVVLGFILILLILRFLYYHSKLLAILRHRGAYDRFLAAASRDPSDFRPFGEIAERQPEIVKLFQEARQSPHQLTVVKPVGYGQVGTASTSAWDNIHDNSMEVAAPNLQSFHRTIGFFRARRNENISPVFWFESFINWPKIGMGQLGLKPDGAFANFLNHIVRILEIVAAMLLIITRVQ